MIGTVFHVSWISLLRDRVALALTLVLPITLFSVFAAVFGQMDRGTIDPVRAAFVIEDEHPFASLLAERVGDEPMIEIVDEEIVGGRQGMLDLVSRGEITVGVVIPQGFFQSIVAPDKPSQAIDLYIDRAHPLAGGLMRGLLQASALQLRHDALQPDPSSDVGLRTLSLDGGRRQVFPIEDHDVLGGADKRPSISFFAAGIGVMFLMFGVAGRSAILIEERETGVLTRLAAARVTLLQLLMGRWLFLVTLGSAQVSAMFVWAWLVFGLDLWTPAHLAGFALLTVFSAAAAAGFGLMLSSMCRSRAQLTGVATVVILVLSAIGGGLFPSFLMPEGLRRVGRLTFNAWALEGYQSVFWYDAGWIDLLPQIGVLLLNCLAFLLIAGWLVSRRRLA